MWLIIIQRQIPLHPSGNPIIARFQHVQDRSPFIVKQVRLYKTVTRPQHPDFHILFSNLRDRLHSKCNLYSSLVHYRSPHPLATPLHLHIEHCMEKSKGSNVEKVLRCMEESPFILSAMKTRCWIYMPALV